MCNMTVIQKPWSGIDQRAFEGVWMLLFPSAATFDSLA